MKEGPQWFVSKLDLEGAPESDLPYLLSTLQSTEGEPFSDANVAADRDTILSYYYNNGYPDAAFDWTQSPGPSAYRVNLVYKISPGKREYVRSVHGARPEDHARVAGRQAHSAEARRSDIAKPHRGEPAEAVRSGHLFESADGDSESGRRRGQQDTCCSIWTKPTGIRSTAESARNWGGSAAGVTTFDEPAGTTGFSPRISLGISRLNLFGEARTLSLQTRFSTIEQRALLSYTAPQLGGNENLTLTISGLFDNSRDIRTFAAQRAEGSVQLAQRLTRANSVQYRFTFRHVTIKRRRDFAGVDPAAFAAGTRGIDFDDLHSGPPRRSDQLAPRDLQHHRRGGGAEAVRLGDGVYAAADAQLDISSDRARRGDRAHAAVRLDSAAGGAAGDSAGGTILCRRRDVESRFPGQSGRSARSGNRFPDGRQRAVDPFDGAAFSADRRQSRRRTVSRYGQRLFGRARYQLPVPAERSSGFRLYGAGRRVRDPLSDADRSDSRGFQPEPEFAAILWVPGHLRSVAGRTRAC